MAGCWLTNPTVSQRKRGREWWPDSCPEAAAATFHFIFLLLTFLHSHLIPLSKFTSFSFNRWWWSLFLLLAHLFYTLFLSLYINSPFPIIDNNISSLSFSLFWYLLLLLLLLTLQQSFFYNSIHFFLLMNTYLLTLCILHFLLFLIFLQPFSLSFSL